MAEGKVDISEVWEQIKDVQTVYMATSDGDQPRVRPLMLLHADRNLYVTTGTESAKVAQIKSNPKAEVTWMLGTMENPGSMRILGDAKIVEDRETKTKVAGMAQWFSMFWKSVDDPGYTLLQIVPKKIRYSKPGEMQSHEFTL